MARHGLAILICEVNIMEIKSRITKNVIYSSEKTTVKEVLIEAVSKGADLRGAYLGDADLRGADLGDADLRGADLRRIKITEKEKETIIKELQWEIIAKKDGK
jgi:uncharacterized protein YjbI with pentapeptide repeats